MTAGGTPVRPAFLPAEDRLVTALGPHRVDITVPGAATGQSVGATVFTHEPIYEPGTHVHESWSKFAYVLTGTYHFTLDTRPFIATGSDLLVIPAGVAHGFTTQTGGRLLFVSWPAGNEQMFAEVGQLGPAASAEQIAEVWRRFDTWPV